MAREWIYIGCSPCDEECRQAGRDNEVDIRIECEAYAKQCLRVYREAHEGKVPEGLLVRPRRESYGDALEVAAGFRDGDREAFEAAYWLEQNSPKKWDLQSKLDREVVEILRDVNVDGYRLITWDTPNRCSTGQWQIGYAFYEPGNEDPLFIGEDCGVSPMHTVDSDEALRALLGFLTLKPGDTDQEYFDAYTPRQLAWCKSKAEELQEWGFEQTDSEDPLPEFRDW
jgi:hypothetical protein